MSARRHLLKYTALSRASSRKCYLGVPVVAGYFKFGGLERNSLNVTSISDGLFGAAQLLCNDGSAFSLSDHI
jgi:hypothetical protein